MTQIEFQGVRSAEVVRIQQLPGLGGVDFWSVTNSERHWAMIHETFTACFVLGPQGAPRGRWCSRGKERIVSAGCVQLMEPGEAHRTTAVAEPASFFVTWWRPEVLQRAALELGISRQIHWKSAQLEAGALSERFADLAQQLSQGADSLASQEAYAEATSGLLRSAADSTPNREPTGRFHPGVRRAIELLRQRFREAVSLEELAKEARLTKFHFSRCFREATGFPPHQYQKLLRVHEARRLLEQGCSVEEAGATAGFADAPHLSRAFREWLGVPPGAWARARRPTWSYSNCTAARSVD
jgi:AraC-like DNA-binding protein